MDARVIRDPENYTAQDLKNYDWDVIELPITVNASALMDWFREVEEKYSDCSFNVQRDLHLVNPAIRDRVLDHVENRLLWGRPEQWTLQWVIDRDGAIPLIFIADPAQFPEIDVEPEIFDQRPTVNLKKYMFGEYKKVYDALGDDCMRVTRMVRFKENCGLKPHKDIDPPGFLPRLHIQLSVSNDAWWHFGDSHEVEPHGLERVFHCEAGRVYIMNTAVPHEAKNESKEIPWIMIHTNPTDSAIDRLLKLEKLHIE